MHQYPIDEFTRRVPSILLYDRQAGHAPGVTGTSTLVVGWSAALSSSSKSAMLQSAPAVSSVVKVASCPSIHPSAHNNHSQPASQPVKDGAQHAWWHYYDVEEDGE